MRRTLSFACKRLRLTETSRATFVVVLFLLAATTAFAATPEWLRQAAQVPVPGYADDIDAVILLEEKVITVTPAGEINTRFRKAYKILRPAGRRFGTVVVDFDSETRLTFFKGWSVTSRNEEYEVKEKDASATSMFSESLYSDTSYEVLKIPAPQPGNVIGYEYQHRERAAVLQSIWTFQRELPVRCARLTLELPAGWTYSAHWFNHPALTPRQSGDNRWTWELADVAPIQSEPDMPAWRALAGHLGISLMPARTWTSRSSSGTWSQIGRWYADLAEGRRDTNPQIREKVRQLVAGDARLLEKIRRLTFYVQHSIRYVAIEIGIGGYQPHFAQDVLINGYGDCKDKVTLLSAMLHEVGIDSYYLLINSERGFTAPDFPTMLSFDHVILAIRLPQTEMSDLFAIAQHEKLGRLLLFDPTDSSTPLGYLPPQLQANEGLLVTDEGGELLRLPLLPSSANSIERTAKLTVDRSGNLEGSVQELRRGPAAASFRQQLSHTPKLQFQKLLQNLLSSLLDGAVLTAAKITGRDSLDVPLQLEYSFKAPNYAQQTSQFMLLHACALCRAPSHLLERKPRKLPVCFPYAKLETDSFEISYPAGYLPDELPQPMDVNHSFASYKSNSRSEASTFYYSRILEIKDVLVPAERLDELKMFFRQITDDQRAYVILKSRNPMGN